MSDRKTAEDIDKLGIEPTIHYLECRGCPSTSMNFLNYEKMIKHWNTRALIAKQEEK